MSTPSVGRLNKRHAILTGAGGGIGAAVAAAFLREGALCSTRARCSTSAPI